MQTKIPRINDANYKEILAELFSSKDRENVIHIMKDVIQKMPHKSLLMSNLVNDIAKTDICFKERLMELINDIVATDNIDHLISAAFTVKRLGFHDSDVLDWVKRIPMIDDSVFSRKELSLPPDKILEECKKKVEKVREISGYEDIERIWCVMQTMKNFDFSIQECLVQLTQNLEQNLLIGAVRIIYKEINSLYLSVLLFEFMKKQGFLKAFFEILPSFDEEFRDTFLPLLFEHFYNKSEESSVYIRGSYVPLRFEEDILSFRSLVTESTIKIMLRISGFEKVSNFFPGKVGGGRRRCKIEAISRKEFDSADPQDRAIFFKKFCLLGSQSVSHFLTYLEMYKSHFSLGFEDQKLFLSVFFEVFSNEESFRHIILNKMVLFGIVSEELVKEFHNFDC